MMTPLTALPHPFIVCNVTERTPEAAIATMRLARFDGADAYELNLPALAAADRDALERVIACVARPVYTSCRRADFMTVYGIPANDLPIWSDEERMARQLDALALGSVALDMEMDSFDPRPAPPLGTPAAAVFARTTGAPAEITDDAAALARQRQVIAAAHEAGGEVILSCHTGRSVTAASLVKIARLAVERGADLVKIVMPCQTRSDLFAVFEATARLGGALPVPFVIIGAGEAGTLSRMVGVNLGSAWAIGQQTLTPGGFHPQPLVAHLREVMRLVPWSMPPEDSCA